MKAWFLRLGTRDQLSLLVLGLVLGLYLAYALLWSPLAADRDRMAQQNAAAAASLLRVDGLVSELVQLRQSGAQPGQARNLASVVNQTTGQFGLAVSRLQPGSRGDLQIRLENASFSSIIAWLHTLEQREGLLLEEVAVTQAGSPGLVNATVRIGQGV
ncbi:MAG TPA: type II secretion system protein GspM [Kineobactrum sp.]